MTIRYEANPPKILPGINKDESIEKFVEKIKTISKKCDAIHLTENVLGHERVSPLEIGKILKKPALIEMIHLKNISMKF